MSLNMIIDYQKQGKMVPASAGDKITMHCKFSLYIPLNIGIIVNQPWNFYTDVYNDSTGEYDQSAAINGKIVSTISTGK